MVLALVLCALAFLGAAPQDKQDAKAQDNKDAKVKGDPAKGKEVFEANCSICHNADTNEDKVGPGLKGISKKGPHKLSDGTDRDGSPESLRKQVMEGGGQMPPIGSALSEEEVDNVVAYLMTL